MRIVRRRSGGLLPKRGDFLKLETDHAKLLTAYQPRFQKVLPPRKVARFYQLENKLRAALNYQLAQDVPFVK